jgi:hypothetical protein
MEVKMKRALVIVLVLSFFAFAFAQDALTAVSGVNEAGKIWQTDPSGAARGIAGGVDLDGDGYLEFYATNYDDGNVVVGFEAIGGDTLEYFWQICMRPVLVSYKPVILTVTAPEKLFSSAVTIQLQLKPVFTYMRSTVTILSNPSNFTILPI